MVRVRGPLLLALGGQISRSILSGGFLITLTLIHKLSLSLHFGEVQNLTLALILTLILLLTLTLMGGSN